MRPANINTTAHKWMLERISGQSTAIDATCGGGRDTLFLAQHCAFVYAFDVQEEAIKESQERTMAYKNISYFLASHDTMDCYVKEAVDIVVFNLGYLPGGDESIVTKPQTTIIAIEKALRMLRPRGSLFISCYVGHAGGQAEYEAVLAFIQTHPEVVVIRQYTYAERANAPILFELQDYSSLCVR